MRREEASCTRLYTRKNYCSKKYEEIFFMLDHIYAEL